MTSEQFRELALLPATTARAVNVRSKSMRKSRRNHAAGFKARVVLAAVKGDKTPVAT
jgi:hypothetical protein